MKMQVNKDYSKMNPKCLEFLFLFFRFCIETFFGWSASQIEGVTTFGSSAFFAMHEDWRKGFHCATSNRRKVVEEMHKREIPFRMIVLRTGGEDDLEQC